MAYFRTIKIRSKRQLLLSRYRHSGFFVNRAEEKKVKMNIYNDIITSKQKVKTVILILTHSCNLRCTYCYEHNKGFSEIDTDVAKQIIEREMTCIDYLDREIEFFGGEPFLEFDKIVELHEFLINKKWQKKWLTMITTNGTLVHGKIKDWVYKNQDTVKVALSADGTALMHNINRSNSFDQIDLDFFANTNSVVKMTVSAETLHNLSDGVIYLHNRGFETVRANLAFGIDWSNDNNLLIYSSELQKLADFYLENPQFRPSDILSLPIENMNPQSKNSLSRHCGAGVELVAYETDGTAYPCHTFAPISVPAEIARKSLYLSFDKEIPIDLLDEKCRNCPVSSVCPNCYGINFSSTGNMYSKSDHFCRMTKVQFLANAYFRYKQYRKNFLDLSPEEEYRLINNIKMIQKLEL